MNAEGLGRLFGADPQVLRIPSRMPLAKLNARFCDLIPESHALELGTSTTRRADGAHWLVSRTPQFFRFGHRDFKCVLVGEGKGSAIVGHFKVPAETKLIIVLSQFLFLTPFVGGFFIGPLSSVLTYLAALVVIEAFFFALFHFGAKAFRADQEEMIRQLNLVAKPRR